MNIMQYLKCVTSKDSCIFEAAWKGEVKKKTQIIFQKLNSKRQF